MLYQLLTGSRPYLSPGEEDSSEAVLRAVQSRAPRPVHALVTDVPPELEAICDKAMSREPADRYASTMELAADLRAFLEQRVVGAYETGAIAELRKWMQRNRRLAVAIGAGAVAVLVGLAVSTVLYLDAVEQKRRADANAGRLEQELRRSQLAQGRLAGASGQLARAEEILWREHLRDPGPATHWRLWELYARSPRRDSVTAPLRTYDSAVTPDGALVLVPAGVDLYGPTELLLLDARTLSRLATLECGAGFQSVAVDAAGREALTAGMDGVIRLWDLLTRRVTALTDPLGVDVRDVAHHAGLDRWLLACDDGRIRVLDRAAGVVDELDAGVPMKSLAISPDGALLAAGGEDGSIRLWRDLVSEPERVLDAHRHWVIALAFTTDGRLFAGSLDQTVTSWDVATGERLRSLDPDNGDLHGVLFGADGLVALGGWYRTDILDAASLELESSVFVPGSVMDLARPSPDHLTIVHNAGLMNWDLESSRMTRRFGGLRGWLASDHREGRLVLGDRDGRVRVHDAESGAAVGEWTEEAPVEGVALRPGGRDVAVLSGKLVRLRDIGTGAVRASFPGGGGASSSRIAFSPDGSLVLTTTTGSRGEPRWGGADTPFELRDAETGEVVAALGRPDETALALCFSPTGDLVAFTTRTRSAEGNWVHWISVWTVEGEERLHAEARSAWRPAISPDGARLAVGQWARDVEVWDLASGERSAVLRGHTGNTWSADWHPTEPDVLVSGSDDGTVRLWSVDDGDNLLTIEVPGTQVRSVRFGPAGETIAASGTGDEALVFDLTYFDRHIAGNAARQVELLSDELGGELHDEHVLDWTQTTLARPGRGSASDRRGARRRRSGDSLDLLARLRAGDHEAIEALMGRHLPGLRAYVRVQGGPLLRAKEESTDIVQSVCREVLEKLDRFRYPSEAGFRHWLYTTALRKIRDRYDYYLAAKRDVRRELAPSDRSQASRELVGVYGTICTPSREAAAREEVARIEEAFDRLPDHYREVLVQSRLLGLSSGEIGQRIGMTANAVRQLLYRATARLASLLDGPGA